MTRNRFEAINVFFHNATPEEESSIPSNPLKKVRYFNDVVKRKFWKSFSNHLPTIRLQFMTHCQTSPSGMVLLQLMVTGSDVQYVITNVHGSARTVHLPLGFVNRARRNVTISGIKLRTEN